MGEPSDEIDPKVVHNAVQRNSDYFQYCYEGGLFENPGLAGRVQVRFIVQEDGSVAQALAVDTNLPPQVAQCIAKGFYSLRMPAQAHRVTVEYPMYFTPG